MNANAWTCAVAALVMLTVCVTNSAVAEGGRASDVPPAWGAWPLQVPCVEIDPAGPNVTVNPGCLQQSS